MTLDTSTLISLGALVLAALSYRRAGGVDRRDKQRHEAGLAADAAKKRAELVVVSQEGRTHRSGEPTISITNVGPATSATMSVTVDDTNADEEVASLRWFIEWQDDRDDGPHKLVTDVRPPPPAVPMIF